MKFFIETVEGKQYLVLKDENGSEISRSILNPNNSCAKCPNFVGACIGNCNLMG